MQIPDLAQIEAMRMRLGDRILETPVWHWNEPDIRAQVGDDTQVILKLELFQRTGSFKPRGALAVMLDLDSATLARGVTAVSAGNHAIAVAYAAHLLGAHAKVVMPKTASPFRVARCQAYGAEVVLVDNVQAAFAQVEQIRVEEKRALVHPFEGPLTALGTATIGLEFCRQAPDLDAVIIPIGGGGLIAGMATAIKAIRPQCRVYGVEPTGAAAMSRSLAAGSPQTIEKVETIADSLGAPHAAPYSFELCRTAVDEIVLIEDHALQQAMALLFSSMKLATEPAGAAATAALCGPLLARLRGQRVGVIVCGSNLDIETFARHVTAGIAPAE